MVAKRHIKLSGDDTAQATAACVERQCAVTRAALPAEQMLRFVLAPDGVIVPDLDCRLPGRGVWLTATRKTLDLAVKSRTFSRSLKQPVQVPDDLTDRVESLLVRRLGETLSLATKAGLTIAGFQQVDAALDKGGVAAMLHGCDAAADGRGKLDRKFQAIQKEMGAPAPIVDLLTIAEMSLAMGRPSVVHAALIPGGLTERFLRAAERVERYRSAPGAPGHDNPEPNRTEG